MPYGITNKQSETIKPADSSVNRDYTNPANINLPTQSEVEPMTDIAPALNQQTEPMYSANDFAHLVLAADAALDAAQDILKLYENDPKVSQAYYLVCAADAALSDVLDDLGVEALDPDDQVAATPQPFDPMSEVVADPYMRSQEMRWCVTGADERRVAYTTLEMRDNGDGSSLVGYAAIFDSPSEPMPFIEYVKRGAFSKTLNDGADVRLLIDHEGVPLARTKSGTLQLSEDNRGLRVEAQLDASNPDAAKIMSAMKRGDISQMSFAFRTIKDSWSADRSTRELREVQLFDVSVVTFPAYEATVAELRNTQTPVIIAPTSKLLLRKSQIAVEKLRSR